jgi:hypothetical protein
MKALAVLVATAALAGCSKPTTDAAPPAASTSAQAPVASASAAPARSAAAPTASAGASSSWHGSYKSTASALEVPADWKKVHWSDTQSTAGVGDGTMALAVDGAPGRVTGSVDGPLGPATVDGVVADGKLSATIRRKDPADHGFTGTLLGAVKTDRIGGTMDVSLGTAGVVRTASVVLTPGAGG